MEWTIDQLAPRAGMTVRNIREWQTHGVISPPERRGRIGIYGEQHLAQIERVKRLQAEGFPLGIIKRMTDLNADSEAPIRQMAAEVLNPFTADHSQEMSRRELRERLGEHAQTVLEKLGLIAHSDGSGADTVTIRHATTVTLLEDLLRVGMQLDNLVDTIAEIDRHQRTIAQLTIDAFARDVWEPFSKSGFTSTDWQTIAHRTGVARRLLSELLTARMRAALDEVSERVLLDHAKTTEQVLARDPSTGPE